MTILLSVVGIGVVIGLFVWYNTSRHVTGTIRSESIVFGQWTMHPDDCRMLPAGDGVVLSDSSTPTLSAIVKNDPDTGNAAVQLASIETHKMHDLERDRCGQAKLDIHKGEDGISMSGSLAFSCVAEGGMIRGDVQYRNCH